MLGKTGRHFFAGDEVVVRTPGEILATLDADGTLEGLPFMPEMLPYCGRRLHVSRRVEKTCVEGHARQRRFRANDVVLLEELRCTGVEHDGCKRGCMILWKEAWLRHAGLSDPAVHVDNAEIEQLRSRLRIKQAPTHYHCQSTQLAVATEAFPRIHTLRMIWVALREIWAGDRSVIEVAGLMTHWVRLTLRKRRIGKRVHSFSGPNKRTPTQRLDLQMGELVKVKSVQEIVATLDERSRNRGLRITPAMALNCGRQYEVRARVDRMIMERTGEMREIENTVTLQGSHCMCYYVMGSCPRGEFLYWREIWLERAPSSSLSDTGHVRER